MKIMSEYIYFEIQNKNDFLKTVSILFWKRFKIPERKKMKERKIKQ